jgi:spermidine synthase
LTDGYWDDFLALPLAGERGVPQRVAILGDAAGTVARAYGHYYPATHVDAVEIDGELTAIGRRYFGLRAPNLSLYTADARPWLEQSTSRYDAVFLDAYRQPYIPFYLLTKEFFSLVRDHLRPGGMVVVNVGHVPGSDALEKVVSTTLRSVFANVMRDPVSDGNSLVIASEAPLRAAQVVPAASAAAPGLETVASTVAGRLTPALRGGSVYTDDRAPVEWLTDLSLLGYAAGKR